MSISDAQEERAEAADALAGVHLPGVVSALRRHPAAFVLVAAVLVRLPLVFRDITYRGDIWRQADTASIARNFLFDANLFFPRINWGGAGPGFVESELQLYPWLTSLLYRVFGEHVWLGRALTLAATALGLWLFWRLACRLVSQRAALVALVAFAFAPILLRYGTAFMPEATTIAAYVGALLLFDRWLDDRRWPTALACGGVTSLAVLVKPTALNIGLVFVVLLVLRRGWRGLVQPQAVVLGAISLLPLAAWLWHAKRLHDQYGNTFGVISGGDRKFGDVSYWTSLRFYEGTGAIDFLWVLAVVGAPFAILGVILAVRRRAPFLVPVGVGAVGVYYFLVARYAQGNLGIQYHVYMAVYAALAIGIGVDWLLARRATTSRRGARLITATVVVAAVLFGAVAAGAVADQLRPWGEPTLACASAMRAAIPEPDLVVISSTSYAIEDGTPNNFQDPALFFHSDRYGWSLPADRHDPAVVEQHRREGARWFVITDHHLVEDNPALASYLRSLQQVGPGIDAGCAIYRLPSG